MIAAPYSALEEELLERDIQHQSPTVWRSAQAIHHLGLGVGLRPNGVRAVTAEHVVKVRGTWCVAVQLNGTVQFVPIRLGHVEAILDLTERFQEGPLVHERAAIKELGSMLAYFKAGNSTPWPLAYRYRSTWMLAHLAAGVRIDVIGRAAGVRTPRHILDLLQYLPAAEPDEEMRLLSGAE
ncbi:MAG: hypothetical protein ACR2GF_05045 [Acidimicrobiales bacterium]